MKKTLFVSLFILSLFMSCSGITEPDNTQSPPLQPPSPPPPPFNPLTFDYSSLDAYRQGPLAIKVAEMPQSLRDKLRACFYEGNVIWDQSLGTLADQLHDSGTQGWKDRAERDRTKAAAEAFFVALAEYIHTQGGDDPFLKVKMAHDFTIDYLVYDEELWYNGLDKGTPRGSYYTWDVLRRGKGTGKYNFTNRDPYHGLATCGAYIVFFGEILSKIHNLDSRIRPSSINARGFYTSWLTFSPNDPIWTQTTVPASNHEWNIVEISNMKFIVDTTHDDPLVQSGNGVWVNLFIDPRESIWKRLPESKEAQLLDADGVAPWDDTIVTWIQFRDHRNQR
jgi:hypothetical protein